MTNEDEAFDMNGLLGNPKWTPRWRPSINQVEALKWVIDNMKSYDQVICYLEEMLEEMKEL